MIAGPGAGKVATAVVAVGASLLLWLASCAEPSLLGGPESSGAGSLPGAAVAPSQTAIEPQPTPRPAPPVQPALDAPSATPSSGTPATDARPTDTLPSSGAGQATEPAPKATAMTPPGGGSAGSSPLQTPSGPPPAQGPAVYYVALDDGGSRGVRFGCNDSLVAVRAGTPWAGEPLAGALRRLLDPTDTTADAAGLYNALSASRLGYVSGYWDGTTVVVNLSGQLNPGGVCDNPRIEAQLTHTVVAATGASRAEIYIDGRSLTAILSLR